MGTTVLHQPRRTLRRLTLSSLTAVMLANHITPGDCFSAVQNDSAGRFLTNDNPRSASSSALRYASSSEPEAVLHSGTSFTNTIYGATKRKELPVWLSINRSHLYQQNMDKLTTVLRESHFSEDAIQKLRRMIVESTDLDRNMAAGAAEFCLILAESMEMGLHTLTAAVEHYCACVRNREHGIYDATSTDPIVIDAAHLKQLEMVASLVNQNGNRMTANDAENLRHLLLTETRDWRGLAIRSAASLFRLRGILSSPQATMSRESIRTSREALYIYAPLASRLGMHRLKNELEGSAFRILYKRQYAKVYEQHDDQTSESMRSILESVQLDMKTLLESDTEFQKNIKSFHISARVKEPYSLWRKMLAHGYKHVLQVPDALALRIVLTGKQLAPDEPIEMTEAREKALCYYAQQLCTLHWKPVESNPRFKDYIQKPKPNGYQSLHYTAQVQDNTLEVQVRTAVMHHTAEFGPRCNHWNYKASLGSSNNTFNTAPASRSDVDASLAAYLRNFQQWHHKQQHMDVSQMEDVESDNYYEPMNRERAARIRARTEQLQPYLKAVKAAQSDLTMEHVYVFMNSRAGQVLALPAGACVLDALRVSTNDLFLATRINGQDCSVTRRLHNGDYLQLAN